jgi:hypothetical protein
VQQTTQLEALENMIKVNPPFELGGNINTLCVVGDVLPRQVFATVTGNRQRKRNPSYCSKCLILSPAKRLTQKWLIRPRDVSSTLNTLVGRLAGDVFFTHKYFPFSAPSPARFDGFTIHCLIVQKGTKDVNYKS